MVTWPPRNQSAIKILSSVQIERLVRQILPFDLLTNRLLTLLPHLVIVNVFNDYYHRDIATA